MAVLDAQLTGDGDHLGDIVGGGGHLRGHLFDAVGKLFILCIRRINRFADGRERALIADTRLDRRSAQREDRRGERGGECAPNLGHGLAGGIAFLPKVLQRFPGSRPRGRSGLEFFITGGNIRMRLFHGGAGVV